MVETLVGLLAVVAASILLGAVSGTGRFIFEKKYGTDVGPVVGMLLSVAAIALLVVVVIGAKDVGTKILEALSG